MRFFVGTIACDYNEENSDFPEVMLNNCIQGPQKFPLEYFRLHFEKGGNAQHPYLGDLNAFADKIEDRWLPRLGANLVLGYLKAQLANLNAPENKENDQIFL